MNLSALKAEIAQIRSERSKVWIVVNPKRQDIYYEAIDESDAKHNCPPGYCVACVTEEELEKLILR